METGIIIKGDYKGRSISIDFGGKSATLSTKAFSLKKSDRIKLTSEVVKEINIISESGATASGSFIKESVWGTAAAINGAKNKVLFEIIFKDGKKSLVEGSKKLLQAIQIGCYE